MGSQYTDGEKVLTVKISESLNYNIGFALFNVPTGAIARIVRNFNRPRVRGVAKPRPGK